MSHERLESKVLNVDPQNTVNIMDGCITSGPDTEPCGTPRLTLPFTAAVKSTKQVKQHLNHGRRMILGARYYYIND